MNPVDYLYRQFIWRPRISGGPTSSKQSNFDIWSRDTKRNVSRLLKATNLVNFETNLEKASPTEKV